MLEAQNYPVCVLQGLFHVKIVKLTQLLLLKFFEFVISRSSKIFGFFYKLATSIAFILLPPPPPQPPPPPPPPPPPLVVLIVTVSKFYVKIIYGYLYATSYSPDQLSSSLFCNFASSIIRQ
jgi:hypothetical protein